MNNTQTTIGSGLAGLVLGASIFAFGPITVDKAGVSFHDDKAVIVTVIDAKEYLSRKLPEYESLSEQIANVILRPQSDSNDAQIIRLQDRQAKITEVFVDAGYDDVAEFVAEKDAAAAQAAAENQVRLDAIRDAASVTP